MNELELVYIFHVETLSFFSLTKTYITLPLIKWYEQWYTGENSLGFRQLKYFIKCVSSTKKKKQKPKCNISFGAGSGAYV